MTLGTHIFAYGFRRWQKKDFYTSVDNQTSVSLRVYETTSNERYVSITDEAFLGECRLALNGDLPQKSTIEVSFTLSENGILSIEGREPKSGKSVQATMESRALLAEDELFEQKEDLDKLIRMY